MDEALTEPRDPEQDALASPREGSLLGPWRVDEPLGAGGMATVHAATHSTLGRRAALKVLRPGLFEDAEARSRFVREGRVLAALRHPHCVEVYDVGVEDGRVYLVLELLEGETLAQRLARERTLEPAPCVDLALPLCAALAAAHAAGVVHRDLKPSNLFLARGPSGTRPCVLDFGASRLLEAPQGEALTRSRSLLGTPAYMAPEQADGARDLDGRCDQYALALCLYECLAGHNPFAKGTWLASLSAVASAPLPPLRRSARAVPAGLARALERALRRDRAQRFASLAHFGDALAPFASPAGRAAWSSLRASLPPSAEPPAPPRRPWLLAAAALAVLLPAALVFRPRAPAAPSRAPLRRALEPAPEAPRALASQPAAPAVLEPAPLPTALPPRPLRAAPPAPAPRRPARPPEALPAVPAPEAPPAAPERVLGRGANGAWILAP